MIALHTSVARSVNMLSTLRIMFSVAAILVLIQPEHAQVAVQDSYCMIHSAFHAERELKNAPSPMMSPKMSRLLNLSLISHHPLLLSEKETKNQLKSTHMLNIWVYVLPLAPGVLKAIQAPWWSSVHSASASRTAKKPPKKITPSLVLPASLDISQKTENVLLYVKLT